MDIQFSKGGNASYTAILEAIKKNQTVTGGKLKPASLAKVAGDLGITVRECRQALQRFRKKRPDYVREKIGSVTLADGSKLHWNAYSEPIEYAITGADKPPTAKKGKAKPKPTAPITDKAQTDASA